LATWAADVIRKWFYGWQARKQLRAMKYAIQVEKSVLVIQKYCRGWLARKQLQEMMYVMRVERSVVVIQKFFRGWRVGFSPAKPTSHFLPVPLLLTS